MNKNTTATKSRKSSKPAVKRPVGRPPTLLNFNFGDRAFTVKDVENRYAKSPTKKITRVAITAKLRKLVESGAQTPEGKVLVISGKKVVGRGRPWLTYKYVTPAEAARMGQPAETVAAE
jgi:hypothetical protein